MERFASLDSVACPLGLENVDTDQLIPARFMSRSRAQGYGGYLLHDLRFDGTGTPRAEALLNQSRYAGSGILVARRNFGTGSSREAAVYALWDYGIRAVVAPSFGDIFASNAVKNGLLPAAVAANDCETLLEWLKTAEKPAMTVDLTAQTIRAGSMSLPFLIDPVSRLQLLNGWDDIDLTRQHTQAIAQYRARRAAAEGWIFDTTRQGK